MSWSVPEGFIDSGEVFRGGATPPVEAQEAAHDYAHEGYYFRIVPERLGRDRVTREWHVYVMYGREKKPACCVNKRTYVNEAPTQLWEPRSTPSLRRKTGHTKNASRRSA